LAEIGRLPELVRQDLLAGLQSVSHIALPVIGAWLLTGPLIGLLLYGMVRPAMFKLMPEAAAETKSYRQPGRLVR